MNILTSDQFAEFFKALHGHEPYSWQIRLAERAIHGDWPEAIDLPTGSGKTACIDVALFALAVQAGRGVDQHQAPRRIFFCVNRRVIVDEAHDRACRIATKLREAENRDNILGRVARALRTLAGTTMDDDSPPLDVLELRGGIYRDNRWARTPTQPTVICTTVDQLGSRLLFRGYGVSPNAAPIQAALIAYDSLILLDEAHISQPFRQTLCRVRDYLDPDRWAEEKIGAAPMIVVPMSATLENVDPNQVIRLEAEDRQNVSLQARLQASKPTSLEVVKDVSVAIIEKAKRLAESGQVAIGIIVNRVATAKDIYKELQEHHENVHLVIGSMRPIDRDEQSNKLKELVGKKRPNNTKQNSIIIATQCLEVGADYDFDVLLTECASLDALRQRFGRLNRGGRPLEGGARAVVFIKEKDVKTEEELTKPDSGDPIYGSALAKTWNWLWRLADVVAPPETQETEPKTTKRGKGKAKPTGESRSIDFGIDHFSRLLGENEAGQIPRDLLAPSASLNAPVMLPAYPDFWCQTSPRPVPDPDVSLFIHGEKSDKPDVQVCWRDDLTIDQIDQSAIKQWCDIVALLPPTASECMSVPIGRIRKWLKGDSERSSDTCDLLEIAKPAESEANESTSSAHRGVLWRGAKKSRLYPSEDQLKPGDTLVLPISEGGWDELGHIPPQAEQDRAEAAFESSRGKWVLRIHPSRFPTPTGKVKDLLDRIADQDDPLSPKEWKTMAKEALNECKGLANHKGGLHENDFNLADYPDERGVVLTSRKRRLSADLAAFLSPLDEGEDEPSWLGGGQEVTLKDHTKHVCDRLVQILDRLATTTLAAAYRLAAELHDWGKIDDRFQAMLRETNRTDAWLFQGEEPEYLAKSADGPNRARKFTGHGFPDHFRHEMLSAQMAERKLPPESAERDFIIHLIESHHGRARPFAPVVLDEDPPDVSYEGVKLSANDRLIHPSHRCDSSVAERFWTLNRRFGWWGLAYLEALLRIADQQASANEAAGEYRSEPTKSEEINA